MESKRKYINKENLNLDMKELSEIIDTIFNSNIRSSVRKKEYVEARMAFSKILRDMGVTHVAIAAFLNKNHCSIVHYMINFDNYFNNNILKMKYEECRNSFFEKRPVDRLHLERNKISALESKYRRFKAILDIMDNRTPYGKEEALEKKIVAFLNGI